MSPRSIASRPWSTLAGAAALVGGSWLVLQSETALNKERDLSDRVRTLRRPQLDPVVGVATDLGSVFGLVGASVVLATMGRQRHALQMFTAGSIAWGVAQAAKPLANRPRPYDQGHTDRLVSTPAGTSWPSGHSAVATAMGATIACGGSPAACLLGTGLSAFVGTSRVYVGVHHPTDVSAGIGVGLLSHMIGKRLADVISRRTATSGR